MTTLRCVLLFSRDVPRTARFYSEGLRLAVRKSSDSWCELETGGTPIHINGVDSEAALTPGYNPFLSFDVESMEETISSLVQLGASMDGPIKYEPHGKVAALRSPDGHMVSLFEPGMA